MKRSSSTCVFICAIIGILMHLNVTSAADDPVVAAQDKKLYTFEKGTDGWWTYAAPNSKIKLSNETPGAADTQQALKMTFSYGKGMAYVGAGVHPKFAMKGKDSFAEYAGGHLALDMKSATGNKVTVQIRTADKKSYSITIPAMSATWGHYQIPFDKFKSKTGSFDPATEKVGQIVIVPQKGKGDSQEISIDNITLSSQKINLSTDATKFTVTGKVTCDKKPLPGAKVTMSDIRGIKTIDSGETGANGAYTVTYALNPRSFAVSPKSACPEKTQYDGSIMIEKEGYTAFYQQMDLKEGNNKSDVVLSVAKTLPELKVQGNRLVDPNGKEVWLQGMSLDSLEWSATGDYMLRSTMKAITEWKVNCIRLPIRDFFWFGDSKYQKDKGKGYRTLIDKIVKICSTRGVYLVLDLHQFGAPLAAHATFWKDAAAKYKDNPAVLYELFNEPHGISWDVWKNGGSLKVRHKENAVVENHEKIKGDTSIGMQALVDAVRSTGAKNVVIAGGVGWSYDLSGILKGYALEDSNGGNGIMYSHHNYPWKIGWQKAVLDAAEKYPIFIGEVGNIRAWSDFPFIKANEQFEDLSKMEWPKDMLGMIQKYRLNWTGFSFHPRCGPMIISDWDYTPTPYWGVFVKDALAGKQFTLNRIR